MRYNPKYPVPDLKAAVSTLFQWRNNHIWFITKIQTSRNNEKNSTPPVFGFADIFSSAQCFCTGFLSFCKTRFCNAYQPLEQRRRHLQFPVKFLFYKSYKWCQEHFCTYILWHKLCYCPNTHFQFLHRCIGTGRRGTMCKL